MKFEPTYISIGLSLVVVAILLYVNFVRLYRARATSRKKQEKVDQLSRLLSDAISDLLNRQLADTNEVPQFRNDFDEWCGKAKSILQDRRFFTESDEVHFDRLGTVVTRQFAHRVNNEHQHILSMLDIKFERLRDIVMRNNATGI